MRTRRTGSSSFLTEPSTVILQKVPLAAMVLQLFGDLNGAAYLHTLPLVLAPQPQGRTWLSAAELERGLPTAILGCFEKHLLA